MTSDLVDDLLKVCVNQRVGWKTSRGPCKSSKCSYPLANKGFLLLEMGSWPCDRSGFTLIGLSAPRLLQQLFLLHFVL